MFVLFGGLIGAILGGLTAKRRKGKGLDILQYAVVYALIFALVGMFVTLVIHRMAI